MAMPRDRMKVLGRRIKGSREGARKRDLTREWLDLLLYDSEEDGDEGFDEGEEEQLQPRVGEDAEETGRGALKLECLRKDWENWDEKGQRRGDTMRPWRYDESGESDKRGRIIWRD